MDIIYKAAAFLAKLIGLYSTVIVIRIMLTWIQLPEGPAVSFLKKICDPYLNLFRSNKTRIGMVDFSPIVSLMVLNILQSVLSMFASYGQITVGIILALLISGLWQYLGSYIFVILLILIAIRWFAGRTPNNPRSSAFIQRIEPVLYKPVHFVYKLFFNGKGTSDQTILIVAFIFYLIAFVAVRYGINQLIGFLCTL